jgi:hypothetical protein
LYGGVNQYARLSIANKLIRELQRKLPTHSLFETYQKDFLFCQQVLAQQPKDKNTVFNLFNISSALLNAMTLCRNATELVHFRKRIGVKGFNLIFKMSVALHGKQAQES